MGFRWIPSELNHADETSRRFEVKGAKQAEKYVESRGNSEGSSSRAAVDYLRRAKHRLERISCAPGDDGDEVPDEWLALEAAKPWLKQAAVSLSGRPQDHGAHAWRKKKVGFPEEDVRKSKGPAPKFCGGYQSRPGLADPCRVCDGVCPQAFRNSISIITTV